MLAKAVSLPISVVKADSVQGEGTKNRVRREISIVGYQRARFVMFLLDCVFGKMILPYLKS